VHRELSTPALVLRTRPYGESDRIATFITEEHGKVAGIAKGAKNSRRRFAGTLEPFVLVRVVFRQRAAAELAFLVRCELLGRESGREVYALVHDTLMLLDGGAPVDPVLRAFELHLLAATGYAPALDRCHSCGKVADKVADGDALWLALERGELVCRACVRVGEPLRPLGAAAARELALLASRPLAEAVGADRRLLREAAAVAESLIGAVATGPVHTRAFIARTR
jgi:DNA repair protein RecO (recombination protein O)